MQIKTGTVLSSIATFVWSIFMGVTAIAIGLGAAFPPLNWIAKPFVCLNGQMNYGELTSNPLPGTTYTQITWYCVNNQTGAKTELDIFPMVLYSGVIYGLMLYIVIRIIGYISNQRKLARAQGARSEDQAQHFYNSRSSVDQDGTAENTLARMKNLKELRAANMITESEYEQKRSEILKDL